MALKKFFFNLFFVNKQKQKELLKNKFVVSQFNELIKKNIRIPLRLITL